VLFAYIFLVGPENFQSLASAEIQYSALSTATWGQSGDTITYGYDANGSLESKTTVRGGQTVETVGYVYDLRGQLKQVTTTPYQGTAVVTQYKYNPQGIRTEKIESGVSTQYLIDPYNPTGYAQVLEERTGAANSPTTQNRIHYTLGDDVISQAKSVWTLNGSEWVLQTAYDTEYLLYDGHGSTRQLIRPNKTIIDNYSYDSYGILLGGNPTPTSPGATKYLYAGEQFDTAAQSYYLRARYYNPNNGRFNQTDPFAGNITDPQSLHKYAYVHNDPVNMLDPSGMFALASLTVSTVMANLVQNIYDTVNLAVYTAADISIQGFQNRQTSDEIWMNLLFATVLVPLALLGGSLLLKSVMKFGWMLFEGSSDLIQKGFAVIDNVVFQPGTILTRNRLIPGRPGIISGGSSSQLKRNIMKAHGLNTSFKTSGYQAHHIIPIELRNHSILRKIGVSYDDATNGILLHETTMHLSNHFKYTNAFQRALDDIPMNLSIDETMERVYGIQARASEKLLEGNSLRSGMIASEEEWYSWLSKPMF
jgi:RHS repeat-associated protein